MTASLFLRGSRYYVDVYDAEAGRKQYSLGTSDKREATRLLLSLQDALEAEEWNPYDQTAADFLSQSERSSDVSCSVAMRRWLDEKRAEDCSHNTLRTYEGVVDLFLRREGLQKAPLSGVTRDQCETYIRQQDVSRATQRKRWRFLRAWFNWLLKEEYLQTSPLEKTKAPKRAKKMPKALRRKELKTLCREASPWFERVLRFAVYSGLRPSELGRLRWSDVDFDRGLIYVYEQKNGSESTIPLTDAAREVLEKMLIEEAQAPVYNTEREGMEEISRSDQLIFNREGRDNEPWVHHISRLFRKLRKACGLREELSMYSTRHATATILCEEGVSPVFVQKMMRHANLSTTMRYVHLANERVKDEVNVF